MMQNATHKQILLKPRSARNSSRLVGLTKTSLSPLLEDKADVRVSSRCRATEEVDLLEGQVEEAVKEVPLQDVPADAVLVGQQLLVWTRSSGLEALPSRKRVRTAPRPLPADSCSRPQVWRDGLAAVMLHDDGLDPPLAGTHRASPPDGWSAWESSGSGDIIKTAGSVAQALEPGLVG